jgi:hypothetical protein
LVKRVLLALLVGGLAVSAVPAAQAAPLCGPIAGVNCWNGSHYCRIWVAPKTCIHTD